jgi:LuxR family maltose regulon positive regulatory protein
VVSRLLETKLYFPRWRRGLVARPRLSERLNRGVQSKLTLVSAPAGFGKTTLLAEWLAAAPAYKRSAAWLSLDQSDNHAASFWSYLIAALQRVEPHIGAYAISLLQSPQPLPIEPVLTLLLPELSANSSDVVDDFLLSSRRGRWRVARCRTAHRGLGNAGEHRAGCAGDPAT